MDYKIEICVSFEHLYFYTFMLFSAHIDDLLGKQWSEGGECLHFHHHVDLLSDMFTGCVSTWSVLLEFGVSSSSIDCWQNSGHSQVAS
jgi:hypothetical protein